MGPDSQRPVHGPLGTQCCERTQEDKTYDICLTPWKSPGGRLMLRVNRKLGLRQRSRMTHEESRGKAYVEGNRKLGLGCIDRGKKQDLG